MRNRLLHFASLEILFIVLILLLSTRLSFPPSPPPFLLYSTPAAVKQAMDAMQQELSKLYADPVMTATPYRLHAVCVHQGNASLGHYWVYINADTSGLSSLLQSKCVFVCLCVFVCTHTDVFDCIL